MTMYDGYSGNYAAREQAAAASSDAAAAKREVVGLEGDLARLKLACAAMWELVKARTNLREDDLAAMMAQLDAKDGVADGQMTHSVRKCVKCDRTVPSRQNKCMYCGEIQPVDSIFETL